MILLDYTIEPSWDKRVTAKTDMATADISSLLYGCFLGKQTFIVNDVDFTPDWDWTILTFAGCLAGNARELASGKENCELVDTDSGARLFFNRTGDHVMVSANYTMAKAIVSVAELEAAATSYAQRVLDDFATRFPGLRANQELASWYPLPLAG